MQKGDEDMTITYEYYDALYVNLTNRCSNDCAFCVRNKHDNVNGTDDLWLEREPSREEIQADFAARDMSKYKEVVFCGYGEPMIRYDDVLFLAKWLKDTYDGIPVRVNTNGHANLIAGRDITPELKGIVDVLSISLNAENAQKYQKLCRSEFGEAAYEGLLDFAAKAKAFVPAVILSVVDKTMPAEEIEHCREIAQQRGVELRVRPYIA